MKNIKPLLESKKDNLNALTKIACRVIELTSILNDFNHEFSSFIYQNPITQQFCNHCKKWQECEHKIYSLDILIIEHCKKCKVHDIQELIDILPDTSNYVEEPCSQCKMPFFHKKEPGTWRCLSCKSSQYEVDQRFGKTTAQLG